MDPLIQLHLECNRFKTTAICCAVAGFLPHLLMTMFTILQSKSDLRGRGGGWSGGAMVLGKLPVPGRPTI